MCNGFAMNLMHDGWTVQYYCGRFGNELTRFLAQLSYYSIVKQKGFYSAFHVIVCPIGDDLGALCKAMSKPFDSVTVNGRKFNYVLPNLNESEWNNVRTHRFPHVIDLLQWLDIEESYNAVNFFLNDAGAASQVSLLPNHFLIHERCQENEMVTMTGHMRPHQFSLYKKHIPVNIENIYIVNNPATGLNCETIRDLRHTYLTHHFPNATLHNSSALIKEDFAKLFYSRNIFCSPSTFCFSAAMSSLPIKEKVVVIASSMVNNKTVTMLNLSDQIKVETHKIKYENYTLEEYFEMIYEN